MKSRHCHMAAVAELGDILKGEQVSVGGSMRGVTGHAPVDTLRVMLEKKRTALVAMALGAGFLLEASERKSRLAPMGIVAVGADHRTLLHSVPLVLLEVGGGGGGEGNARGVSRSDAVRCQA